MEVEGYTFEQEFTEEEIESDNSASNSSAVNGVNERGISLDWCTCENGTILTTFKD